MLLKLTRDFSRAEIQSFALATNGVAVDGEPLASLHAVPDVVQVQDRQAVLHRHTALGRYVTLLWVTGHHK